MLFVLREPCQKGRHRAVLELESGRETVNFGFQQSSSCSSVSYGKECDAAAWSHLHLLIFKVRKSGSGSVVGVGDAVSHALPEWGALEISEA